MLFDANPPVRTGAPISEEGPARLTHPRRARTIWLQIASKFEPLWDG